MLVFKESVILYQVKQKILFGYFKVFYQVFSASVTSSPSSSSPSLLILRKNASVCLCCAKHMASVLEEFWVRWLRIRLGHVEIEGEVCLIEV